jgi:hypothetical protein
MKYDIQFRLIFTSILIFTLLTACGKSNDEKYQNALKSRAEKNANDAKPSKYLVSDNPMICLLKAKEKLGANSKILGMSSRYVLPANLVVHKNPFLKPAGSLNTCNVDYQSPDNSNKLLRIEMDVMTGEFNAPRPVEISVSGMDASKFSLSKVVFPITNFDIDALQKQISAQKPALNKIYTAHQLQSIYIANTLQGDMEVSVGFSGRFASNDLIDSVYLYSKPNGSFIRLK